jgi:hypothetical protein
MVLLSDGLKTRGHLLGFAIGGGHRFFLGRECRIDKNFPMSVNPMKPKILLRNLLAEMEKPAVRTIA